MSRLKTIDGEESEYFNIKGVYMNPKSITMGELYGEENLLTKDWHDGLASNYIR